MIPSVLACLLPLLVPPQASRELRLSQDDTRITTSARVVEVAPVIEDRNGNGVLLVEEDGVEVDLAGLHLRGAMPWLAPEAYQGFGIVVRARNVTLRNARVSGFRCGILAVGADGLRLEDCDVSDNLRQRLRSLPSHEAQEDWLWPHDNDGNEWLERYGAGIWIEDSRDVQVRRCRARDGQNGLVLDRVTESAICDNDFSFLSGWGIAMWRASDNVVSRNALDFCIRGYEHGVYNRGQDSAGLLMFEQCSRNVVVENSITHGGDGVFAFAGKEALGEAGDEPDAERYRDRGNVGNLFLGNDLSYAAAHGLELTFSFDNVIASNRFVENAICGIWGGYSKRTRIVGNTFQGNGDAGYGLERGGVNIEHGARNVIEGNAFRNNVCGVHLWWDPDEHLTRLPWALANGAGCEDNEVVGNTFAGDAVAVHLRAAERTVVRDNDYEDVGARLEGDSKTSDGGGRSRELEAPPEAGDYPGETRPVGARAELAGREKIVMTEYGPYDWERPHLRLDERTGGRDVYRVLAPAPSEPVQPSLRGEGVRLEVLDDGRLALTAEGDGVLRPYQVSIVTGGRLLRAEGLLATLRWEVSFFPSPVDPREDEDTWRAAAAGETARQATVRSLELPFGGGGPATLERELPGLFGTDLPSDHFGTVAGTSVELPAGTWRLVTRSDDGLRVRVDGELLIDDWTHHAPRDHTAPFEVAEARTVSLEVEHFELDGYAWLAVSLEPAPE